MNRFNMHDMKEQNESKRLIMLSDAFSQINIPLQLRKEKLEKYIY